MSAEFFVRLAVFLPLTLITFQVLMLRRILRSGAWTLLTAGFSVFAIRGAVLLFAEPPMIFLLAASLVGFSLIAGGFHVLNGDLLRVLQDKP